MAELPAWIIEQERLRKQRDEWQPEPLHIPAPEPEPNAQISSSIEQPRSIVVIQL